MAISEQEYAGFWSTLTGKEGADEGVVGGTCTDHTGLLGKKGAKVSCADLRAAQEGKPKGTYTSYTSIPDAPPRVVSRPATTRRAATPTSTTPAPRP